MTNLNQMRSLFTYTTCAGDWQRPARPRRCIRYGVRISEGARMSLFNLDRLSDQEITRLENEFKRWRRDHGQGSKGISGRTPMALRDRRLASTTATARVAGLASRKPPGAALIGSSLSIRSHRSSRLPSRCAQKAMIAGFTSSERDYDAGSSLINNCHVSE
jgi:hypothetical protein